MGTSWAYQGYNLALTFPMQCYQQTFEIKSSCFALREKWESNANGKIPWFNTIGTKPSFAVTNNLVFKELQKNKFGKFHAFSERL